MFLHDVGRCVTFQIRVINTRLDELEKKLEAVFTFQIRVINTVYYYSNRKPEAVFTFQIKAINTTMSASLLLLGNWRVVSLRLNAPQRARYSCYFNFILIDGLTSVCFTYLLYRSISSSFSFLLSKTSFV